MEGWKNSKKDHVDEESELDLPIHKKICSFIDRIEFHPQSKEEIKIPERLLDEDEDDEDFSQVSVLFSDSSKESHHHSSQSTHKSHDGSGSKSGLKHHSARWIHKPFSISKKQSKAANIKQDEKIKSDKKTTSNKEIIHSKRAKKAEKKNENKKKKKGLTLPNKKKKRTSKKSLITDRKTSSTFAGWKKKEKKPKNGLFKNHKKNDKIPTETVKKEQSEIKDLSEQQLTQLKQLALKEGKVLNPDSWEEIDFYPLHPPFVYISLMRDKDTKDRRYLVLEQKLNKEEKKQLQFIIDALQTYSISVSEIEGNGSTTVLQKEVDEIIEDYNLSLTPLSKEKIRYAIQKNLLGFGKINPIMKDPHIEDISCDGAGLPIFLYHRDHGSIQSNIVFVDEDELSGFVMRLAQKCGKHISIAHPMIDATMPDGSRIQMTLSTEVSTKGSTFTIRKFREQPFSPTDLIKFNSFSSEMIAYFWLAIEHGVNGLIAGGTAAGKTSALNAMALFIPRESKIVSIEETREINLPHPNWIPGVSRSGFGDVVAGKMAGEIDLYDLMKAALRQRPEYILVGEIRGREAYVLFQAMATGHTTYSTVHADSTKSLIHRLEGEPINIPRIMLQSLDVVCLQTIARVKNKRARRCKQVIEIIDIDPTTKEILTNEVFRWDPIEDSFVYSGKSYVLEQIRNETNQSREEITGELKQRARVLEWMVKENIHLFDDVASITAQYQDHPDEVIKKVEGET